MAQVSKLAGDDSGGKEYLAESKEEKHLDQHEGTGGTERVKPRRRQMAWRMSMSMSRGLGGVVASVLCPSRGKAICPGVVMVWRVD